MEKQNPGSVLGRYLVPDLPQAEEVLPFLKQIDRNQWYSNFGPLVRELEEQIQSLLLKVDPSPDHGRIHLTTLASGYHALEIALRVLALPRGGCVLLPAITFAACPLAIEHAGLTAVLTDVDPVSWTLTPRIARAAARRQEVSAVMPVSIYGVPLPTDEWDEFTADTGIPVVIDAAAAFEVQRLPRRGLVACSLHATKPFGVGEGGILTGRDPLLIESARRHSNFGMVQKVVLGDGSNAKMSEYHAAVGLAQLKRWLHIKEKRTKLLASYRRHARPLADVVSFHPSLDEAVVGILMLKCKAPVADLLIDEHGRRAIVFHQTYFPPLYRHPQFKGLAVVDVEGGYVSGTANLAEKCLHMQSSEMLMRLLVGVPFHAFMRDEDVESVIKEVTMHVQSTAA